MRNGNISWAKWRVGNRDRQIYRYNYDGLDRMRTGQYYEQSANGGYGLTNWFGEYLTYDLRGNIKTLNRQAPFAGTNCYTVSALDNLTYVYDQNNTGNKVMSITDVGAPTGLSAGTGTYTYTTYGALKTDTRKGITDIRYNHLQLPDRITYGTTGNSLQWIYDAEGNKLRKIATFAGTTTTTDYCNGMEYIKKGTAAYALDAIYHSEGRVKYTGTTPRYEYTLTDHLGNGRVYYTDLNADGAITTADILQDNHYYPFGLNHTDPRRNAGGLSPNKYQYNGKELVDEGGLGWNHYGARCYDAAVGRWWVVDKLTDQPEQVDKSAFAYGWDNPVNLVDPDGNCPLCPLALPVLKAFAAGFAIGAASDATVQMATNIAQGKPATQNLNYTSAAISGVAGALTFGNAPIVGTGLKAAVAVATAESAAKQIANTGNVSLVQLGSDITLNAVGSMVRVIPTQNVPALARQADRTARVAAGDAASSGRASAANSAQSNLASAQRKEALRNTVNATTSTLTGNGLQSVSDNLRTPANTPSMVAPPVPRDNTTVIQNLPRN
jgi:RHS repeat-associated protein